MTAKRFQQELCVNHLGRKKIINHPTNLWGLSLYISVEKRKGAKEQMIVVSNFEFENPLAMYRKRWEIETHIRMSQGTRISNGGHSHHGSQIRSKNYCSYWSLDFAGPIEPEISRRRKSQ